MRRADREVKDFDQILDIMRGCDICELALNDVDGYPYVLPMNFALVMRDGKPALYFHGAREGKKLDLIARDGTLRVFDEPCACAGAREGGLRDDVEV